MNSTTDTLRRLFPAVAAIALFFAVAAAYFAPQFSGEALPQHDVVQYRGMKADIEAQRAATGEDPQWTGGMFGGMPAYLIDVACPAQLVKRTAGRLAGIVDTPAGFLFFAMCSMWAMLLLMGVDPWVGIVGALAYGLSTYFLLIIGAGHITKMWALVYAPLMMGGIWCTMRRGMWAGGAVTALAASLEIGANHPQITYYFLLAAALFWISEGIAALRSRAVPDFAKRTAVVAAAGMLAVGANFSPLWYTARHTPDTIRGGSELAAENAEPARRGLDMDYATAWSYGRTESWNMLIPDFMGGDSGRGFSRDGEVAQAMADYGLEGIAGQLPMYWGEQPYTAGPTYIGAAAWVLGLMGLMLLRRRDRLWVLAAALLALLLSWGHNFMWFTRAAFALLPMYDKFRTVSMILVVVQWAVPLLGTLAVMRLWRGGVPRREALRSLAWSAGAVCGVCLLFAAAGGSLFDFGHERSGEMMTAEFRGMLERSGASDYIAQGLHEELGWTAADAMAAERASVMESDAWRSLLFAALAAAAVAAFVLKKIPRGAMVALLSGIILADMVPVDMRYLSHDDFAPAGRQTVKPTPADLKIMEDGEPGYRVLNLTVSPFNDATTSYFHRSVGGYHGAKLARYQDIIDRYLSRGDSRILDMLDTRYIIVSPDSVEFRPTALGAAWTVGDVVRTDGAASELDMLDVVDLSRVAVVDDRFELRGAEYGSADIELAEYRPNYLRYEYSSGNPVFAVFSEIYYDKGWTAYVDGEEAPYVRADYILRAMELPAGRHTVEWRFRAPGWRRTQAVTLLSSLAVLAWAAAAAAAYVRKRMKKTEKENEGR